QLLLDRRAALLNDDIADRRSAAAPAAAAARAVLRVAAAASDQRSAGNGDRERCPGVAQKRRRLRVVVQSVARPHRPGGAFEHFTGICNRSVKARRQSKRWLSTNGVDSLDEREMSRRSFPRRNKGAAEAAMERLTTLACL